MRSTPEDIAAAATQGLELRRNFTQRLPAKIGLAHGCLRRMLSKYMWDHSRFGHVLSDVQRTRAEFIRIELEIGLTFLDIAANTRDPKHSQRCMCIAIEALRTADKFFREAPLVDSDGDLDRRREQLRQRLREMCR